MCIEYLFYSIGRVSRFSFGQAWPVSRESARKKWVEVVSADGAGQAGGGCCAPESTIVTCFG